MARHRNRFSIRFSSVIAAAGVLALAGCASAPAPRESALSLPEALPALSSGALAAVAGESGPVTVTGHYVAASGEECIRYDAAGPALACRRQGENEFRSAGADMTARSAAPDIAPLAGDEMPDIFAGQAGRQDPFMPGTDAAGDEAAAVPEARLVAASLPLDDVTPDPVGDWLPALSPVSVAAAPVPAAAPVIETAQTALVMHDVDVSAVAVLPRRKPDHRPGYRPVSHPAAATPPRKPARLSMPGVAPGVDTASSMPVSVRPGRDAGMPVYRRFSRVTEDGAALTQAYPAPSPRRLLPPPGSVSWREETEASWDEVSLRPAFQAAARVEARS